MTDPKEAGVALAKARTGGQELGTLPGGVPADEATAYAIQQAAIDAFGQPGSGYKIGATSPQAQVLLKTDHPFAAPLFAPFCHESGAVISEPGYGLLGLEPEFALRLGADLPAREQAYELEDVHDAVSTVHPAFEVIGIRLPNEMFKNALIVTADFGANVGFVAGAGVSRWQGHDLAATPVSVKVDGAPVANGSGASVMRHPLNALAWLANHLSTQGKGLRAGDWISTGTCAGVVPIAHGQAAMADFGPFGQVALTLEA